MGISCCTLPLYPTGRLWRLLAVVMSDIDRDIEQLRRCEYLSEAEVRLLCNKAKEILIEESNIQRVDAPVTVIKLYNVLLH